jgi:SpoVK/Ycf46/Vps4 family AAA+-type ATPase
VDTSYTWEDLQLEPSLKQTLQAVCAQVENQGLVLDQWALRRRYPYGRCVSVLMSGPPGTGKTMTAQVLAARLGLELYQVDLSQIVDKYIGETEKRLKQVFDQAEKSNMVLFFDEADALLGKRSEVKDSKDKYANTEVAYLLQRMESYQGIVLMATNQAGNMDTAFVRRFRYHLVFSLPSEELRRLIWTDALSGIPAEGIQIDYLARQFQLSGAQIKNIALNAAYQAAADGGVLHMDHLVRAVFQELQKEGKVMLVSEFGEYGVMLSDWMNPGAGNAAPHG